MTTILTNAGIAIGQNSTDDIALVWLNDQKQTAAAVAALQADKAGANTARIDSVLSGNALADRFGDPLHNTRTPDLIVQPLAGTIYTGSKAKVAEHGGFAPDDTHVAMLVVNGRGSDDGAEDDGARGRSVSRQAPTTQVAPTILEFLGLNPKALKSVRLEGAESLPR